jgi:hypothetical protein
VTPHNVAALFLPLQHEALKRKAHRCAEVRGMAIGGTWAYDTLRDVRIRDSSAHSWGRTNTSIVAASVELHNSYQNR